MADLEMDGQVPAARLHKAAMSEDAYYRAIFESAVDFAIVATDRSGRITAWNTGAERTLGWSAEEMTGETIDRFFTPEDLSRNRPQVEMRGAMEDGRASDERWHLKKDGSRFWASGEMLPLRAEDGAHIGFIKILRDRTAQKIAAEKQRADAEFLRGVLASSGDCIKVLDLDARLLFMTDTGQRIMEVSDFNAIQGCPWPDFWQDQGNLDAKSAIAAARQGGIGHFHGVANTMAGTRKWWDVQVTPIMDAEGRPERLLSVSRDVTDAHVARERIELALDAGTVIGTWVWDVANDRFIGDRRFARAFSLDPEELAAGLPLARVLESIHPEDRSGVAALIADAQVKGGRYCAEYRVRQLDGAWLWIEANGHCDLDAAGRAVRFPGVLFDIDRRKRHELRQEALLQFGETLRGLHAAAGSIEMDRAAADILGSMLDADRAGYGAVDPVRRSIHVDRDWFSGRVSGSIVGPHLFSDHGTYIDSLLQGDTVSVSDVERDPRTRSGAKRLLAIGVRSLLNVPLMQDGRFVALLFAHSSIERVWTEDEIAFARAVADRTWAAKQQALAEAALRQLNETLEAQVSARTRERERAWRLSQDLLAIAGADGTIMAVNAAWTALLGWTEHDLVGRSFVAFTHPDDLEATVAAFGGILLAPLTRPYEYRLRHADGSYCWFAWTGAFEDGQVYASGRNTTAEHEQEAALRVTGEALRQSQKMEAVGQLTGGLAHDFNNLLTGVTGSLELLQTRIAQGRIKDVDRYVNAAQGAAKRAAALTHRLLAFSRRQTLDPKPTDVNGLVRGMEDLIRRTIGPAITLDPAVSAVGLWPTLVDPGQLENALLNLCINARDAMPDGGKITIETGNRWIDDRIARDRDLAPGQYVSMCVSDTGTGMLPEVLDKAFEPFFTTKPIGQGTGLGLSMIYGFAKQSGGQVRIYSELDQGTMVCIYLPRYLGEAETADLVPELADAPRAEDGQTVLVVDDEPTVRMLVTEVLEDLGYRAIEAADGAAGLLVLQSDVRIDLLVTDVGLPGGMNGRQVADAARVARPELKVLFITGYAENAVISHGHLDPGMHVLTKPFALEALASRITGLMSE